MVIPNTIITISHLKTFLLVDSYYLFLSNVMVSEKTLEMLWLFNPTTEHIYYLILYKCCAKSFTDFLYSVVQSSFLLLELYVNKDFCTIFYCLFFEPLTCLLTAYIDISIHVLIQLQTFNIVDTNVSVLMNLCGQLPVAGHEQYRHCEYVRFEQQECHLLEDCKDVYGCRPVENMQLKKGNLLGK